MTHPVAIGTASPDEYPEVLALVFRHLSAEDRAERVAGLLAGARSGEVVMDGLLEARRGGKLVGGVFAEVQAGRAALVWPPQLAPDEPATTAEQLLAANSEFLRGKSTCVAYALLDAAVEQEEAILRADGFEPIADLLYLVSSQEHFPRSLPSSPLELESYRPGNHDRLARIVQATYEGTLDCPRLNDVRQIEDILGGYRATGVFSAERWLLVRHQGEDVGCLILADHPKQQSWELVYMGLVPPARGNGWGRHLAQFAQWMTGQAGRAQLVLAVDAANGPAIRTYSRLGFQAWARRSVYLKVLGD